MRLLHLIRHASPSIQPAIPSEQWVLSERGIEEAQRLATVAATWDLRAVYSSVEPKAQATALIIGDAVGQSVRVVDGFQELRFDRWVANSDAFADMIRGILGQPDVSVHGAERAAAAAARFSVGVGIVAEGAFPAAIVSHGRVLSAYLAQLLPLEEPFAVWRSIPMPGWSCIDLDLAPKLLEPFSGLSDASAGA